MKFRIIRNNKNNKPYEVYYFDENDNRGPKWRKVIWDEQSYLNFSDNNFVDTIKEAKEKALDFIEKYRKEHGTIVEEFDLYQ